MKTYRFLYKEVISTENIELAIKEACKSRGKKRRKTYKLRALKANPKRVEIVRDWIVNYETTYHKPKEIYDGISNKVRTIYVPSVRETVVQHAVVQVLDKYLSKGTYEHTYAAIKGRGQHLAKKRIERWIRNNPKDVKYYLKMDIKKYFPSIPQDKFFEKLERKIKDFKVITLVKKILAVCDEGIPLGYYISQWIANWYLMDFDHAIKDFRSCFYIRWMDDKVIFSSSKRRLHKFLDKVKELLGELGLTLKENWQIERFTHHEEMGKKKAKGKFLDFMGFRFYRNRTTLRESIFYRMCRKARRIGKKEKPTLFELKQFLSYLGWIKHSDVYKAYLEYIKPYVNIQYIKRRISRHDRREAKNELVQNGVNGIPCIA